MTPAKVQNKDNQIILIFDTELFYTDPYQTTLEELILAAEALTNYPITADEARMIRNLEIGDSFFVGMIEVTKLQ